MDIVAIRRHLLEAVELNIPLVDGGLIVDVEVALEASSSGHGSAVQQRGSDFVR